jgi:hypothetical protein
MSSALPITTVMFTMIFAIFYIAVASIGIETYNKCDAVQGVKKWDNLKMLLSHTLTISITIPIALMVQYLASGRVSAAMGVVYGIMGLVGSAVAYAITEKDECTSVSRENSKNYLIFAIVASILIMMAGGAAVTM